MSLDKEVQAHLDTRKDLPTLSPASGNQSGKIKGTINWSEKSIGVCVIYSDFMFLESNIFFCLTLSFCTLLWNYSGKTNSNNQMEGLNMIHVKLVWFGGTRSWELCTHTINCLLFPSWVSTYKQTSGGVVEWLKDLFLTTRNVYWLKTPSCSCLQPFFKNHSFMQHPWKVIHLPSIGSRGSQEVAFHCSQNTYQKHHHSTAPFKFWLMKTWPNRVHSQSLTDTTDQTKKPVKPYY